MAQQIISNGAFDNDPTAEKIRLAFGKVNGNFTEVYTTIPNVDPATLTGQAGKFLKVNASNNAFELANVSGGGDLLASNNLSELTDANLARENLNLGTSAVLNAIDEDDMSSDSDILVPTQQSVKAYVDNSAVTYTAGDGISISETNEIINTEVNVNVASGVLDFANGKITLTLTNSGTVDILYPGVKPYIDGMLVDKNSGNTDFEEIEIGDRVSGWLSTTRFVAGVVTALPWDDEGNVTFAIDSQAI